MPLSISAEWERLERGPPEERATFAAVSILAGGVTLTEAEDSFVRRIRSSVHLSAYKLAEWFAWNWWRQRWEPRSDTPGWHLAHRMTTVGGGYIWPSITIVSDGERIVLVAKPTKARPEEPLRYIADSVSAHRSFEFEDSIDNFISQVEGQLRATKIETTNLDQIWKDVCEERQNPDSAKRRRLEALLGLDPDEAEAALLDRLVSDMAILGESGVAELAAMSSGRGEVLPAESIKGIAVCVGSAARFGDAVLLRDRGVLPAKGSVPAWLRGARAAQALRAQERLGHDPLSDERLAEMMGASGSIISKSSGQLEMSFAINMADLGDRIVLRPKWVTGRRFELARLLGDHLAKDADEPFCPATRTYTYSQKLQRSFAAELLCPFDALNNMLHGDYSEDRQEEVAGHFNVSPLTVRTLLVNHGLVDRDELKIEFDPVSIQ